MRLVFLGDIVGKPGRTAVKTYLPKVQETLKPDFIVANAENSAHGFGVSHKIVKELFGYGIDCLTTGNHVWDQKEIFNWIGDEPNVLRPANFPEGTPGAQYTVLEKDGKKICVINALGMLFMKPIEDPFKVLDQLLVTISNREKNIKAIFLDYHAEATSEKKIMAYHLDGRVSGVVGTHTHVPTADAMILPGGTAFQSDAGMCGCYDSVIGMGKGPAMQRMIKKISSQRMEPAEGPETLCGTVIDIDGETGQATAIKPIRLGANLIETSMA